MVSLPLPTGKVVQIRRLSVFDIFLGTVLGSLAPTYGDTHPYGFITTATGHNGSESVFVVCPYISYSNRKPTLYSHRHPPT